MYPYLVDRSRRSHDALDDKVELGSFLARLVRRVDRGDGGRSGVGAAHGFERVGKIFEILLRRAQNLLAALLSLLVRHVQQVTHERGVALGVGELVRIHVADGADDALREFLLADFQIS